MENSEDYSVILIHKEDANIGEEKWFFDTYERAEQFAQDVLKSAKGGQTFETIEKVHLAHLGDVWQQWNVIRKEG